MIKKSGVRKDFDGHEDFRDCLSEKSDYKFASTELDVDVDLSLNLTDRSKSIVEAPIKKGRPVTQSASLITTAQPEALADETPAQYRLKALNQLSSIQKRDMQVESDAKSLLDHLNGAAETDAGLHDFDADLSLLGESSSEGERRLGESLSQADELDDLFRQVEERHFSGLSRRQRESGREVRSYLHGKYGDTFDRQLDLNISDSYLDANRSLLELGRRQAPAVRAERAERNWDAPPAPVDEEVRKQLLKQFRAETVLAPQNDHENRAPGNARRAETQIPEQPALSKPEPQAPARGTRGRRLKQEDSREHQEDEAQRAGTRREPPRAKGQMQVE